MIREFEGRVEFPGGFAEIGPGERGFLMKDKDGFVFHSGKLLSDEDKARLKKSMTEMRANMKKAQADFARAMERWRENGDASPFHGKGFAFPIHPPTIDIKAHGWFEDDDLLTPEQRAQLQRGLEQAQRDIEQAQRDAEQAERDAEQSIRDAEQAMRDAEQAMREAESDWDAEAWEAAQEARADALAEIEQARAEAREEARRAREEALREAREAREEALAEARLEREEAQRHRMSREEELRLEAEALEEAARDIERERQRIERELEELRAQKSGT
jgi:hypothetical protein